MKELDYFLEDLEEYYKEQNFILKEINILENNISLNKEKIEKLQEMLVKVNLKIRHMENERQNVELRSTKSC